MLTNSNLTPSEIQHVRSDTRFSADDVTFGRTLFTEGKVGVACLWEPDVSLALAGRAGAHRLFSTSQATELIADVLVASKALLDSRQELAEKLMRVWFAGIEQADADYAAAARAIMAASPPFRDELGYERTLHSLHWVSWSTLTDNVRFFGLDGQAPAFDCAYNQADSIWINYPEAAIRSRFAPAMVRDDRALRKLWAASGHPLPASQDDYDPRVANEGAAVFAKPISIALPEDVQLDRSREGPSVKPKLQDGVDHAARQRLYRRTPHRLAQTSPPARAPLDRSSARGLSVASWCLEGVRPYGPRRALRIDRTALGGQAEASHTARRPPRGLCAFVA